MKSWIEVSPESDFPIQNLPMGIFSDQDPTPRCGVAIGQFVLDLAALHNAGLLKDLEFNTSLFCLPTLNEYMSLNRKCWRSTRARLTALLVENGNDDSLQSNTELRKKCLIPLKTVKMHLPAAIGDYTDFYSSREHATNIGIMLRGADNALQPNWTHLPVGYHGRSSSVVVSGTEVTRPQGQVQINKESPKEGSKHSPCRLLDFELEMAFFVGGQCNTLGKPLTMAEADDHIFGVVLMNDWSARDLQAWEYVPLGPFTAKNFCTSISPWVVSTDALDAFQCNTSAGPVQTDPVPLPYLQDANYASSTYDLALQVAIKPEGDSVASVVCNSNFRHMYWNMRQQLVHHSVSGCNMRAGDLLGSGTISGVDASAFGSMMELSWRGSKEVPLVNSAPGTVRKFLADGDEVIMTGFAGGKNGSYRIGFGQVSGKVLPAGVVSTKNDPVACERALSSISLVEAQTSVNSYSNFKLYSYWRSSSSWRVRTALSLKGISYETVSVNLMALVGNNTDSLPEAFTNDKNPMAQVPVLEFTAPDGSTQILTQSLAIMEFLDDICPEHPLLPRDPIERALARQMANVVACGIQPLQNLSVLRQVKQVQITGTTDLIDGKAFGKHSIDAGLGVLEGLVSQYAAVAKRKNHTGQCYAASVDTPTMADLAIIPQIYNANRFGVDMSKFPALNALNEFCAAHPAFQASKPEAQPDAVV